MLVLTRAMSGAFDAVLVYQFRSVAELTAAFIGPLLFSRCSIMESRNRHGGCDNSAEIARDVSKFISGRSKVRKRETAHITASLRR